MFFKTWRSIVLVLGETCLLLTAVAVGTYLRLGDYGWDLLWTSDGFLKALLIVGVCQVCLHYADLYDLRGIVGSVDLLVRLVQALGATSLILAVALLLVPGPDHRARRVPGGGAARRIAGRALAAGVRVADQARARPTRAAAASSARAPAAIELARELYERRQELGVEIVGFVDPDPAMRRRAGDQPRRRRHDRRHPG